MNFLRKPLLAAVLWTAAAPLPALACGPFFEPRYLDNDGNDWCARYQKLISLAVLEKEHPELFPEKPIRVDAGMSTLAAEEEDFFQALTKLQPNQPEKERRAKSAEYAFAAGKMRNDPNNLPPEVPAGLEEFALYLKGFREIHQINGAKGTEDEIPSAWKQLLALPAKDRHYRTIWVHFMLGNFLRGKEKHDQYDLCRTAAREGFADTAGLARRSFILETRYGTLPDRSLKAAVEAFRSGNPLHPINDWGRLVKRIDKLNDLEYARLVDDPRCREFLAILRNTPRFRKFVKGKELLSADRCALWAYQENDLPRAREYLALIKKETLLSCWIRAKIARFDGDTERAVRLLRQWLVLAEAKKQINEEAFIRFSSDPFERTFRENIYGNLGGALISEREFTEALECFLKANAWDDAAYTAEQFLTLDELTAFVEKNPRSDPRLRYLLGRRAIREGRFDTAGKYLPDTVKPYLKRYADFLAAGTDAKRSADDRALSLYNAAKILRYKGMELCGTEGYPDFFSTRGNFGDNESFRLDESGWYHPETGMWSWTCNSAEIVRPGFHALPKHNQETNRFHYRYRAAELAWKAQRLADDLDLRALICQFGGECLSHRSPQEADVFYKLMVRRAGQTRLGKLADRARWFPQLQPIQSEVGTDEPLGSVAEVKTLMDRTFAPPL